MEHCSNAYDKKANSLSSWYFTNIYIWQLFEPLLHSLYINGQSTTLLAIDLLCAINIHISYFKSFGTHVFSLWPLCLHLAIHVFQYVVLCSCKPKLNEFIRKYQKIFALHCKFSRKVLRSNLIDYITSSSLYPTIYNIPKTIYQITLIRQTKPRGFSCYGIS